MEPLFVLSSLWLFFTTEITEFLHGVAQRDWSDRSVCIPAFKIIRYTAQERTS